MTTPTIFKEYIWLVNTIYRAGKISLVDINKKWILTDMSGGVEMPRTTFNRHRDAIEDIFGIYIDCDRKDGYRYYIGNEKVLNEDSVQNWMLSALTVSNIIGESMNLQHRIVLENIPSDGEYLELVIKAMKEGKRISVTYRRYQSYEAKTFTLSPYCIKLFRQRWYLLGKFDDGGFAVFSFDRMEDITLTDETFTIEKDFNASKFFSECFGVVIGDGTQAERIVLRAFGKEKYYLRDLPLHHTQKELKPRTPEARQQQEENDYSDFEFLLRPTADFKGHLMSRGAWLKVLEPEWLAQEIRQWHEDSIRKFQEN
ncbi:MAG: WYL domain-containing protein [Bacteroidaceae bacterium]|nr:WYL domain-containing protein [Bacteroidaceae bacterium]